MGQAHRVQGHGQGFHQGAGLRVNTIGQGHGFRPADPHIVRIATATGSAHAGIDHVAAAMAAPGEAVQTLAAGEIGQGADAVSFVPAARCLGADFHHFAAEFVPHDGAMDQRRHAA